MLDGKKLHLLVCCQRLNSCGQLNWGGGALFMVITSLETRPINRPGLEASNYMHFVLSVSCSHNYVKIQL